VARASEAELGSARSPQGTHQGNWSRKRCGRLPSAACRCCPPMSLDSESHSASSSVSCRTVTNASGDAHARSLMRRHRSRTASRAAACSLDLHVSAVGCDRCYRRSELGMQRSLEERGSKTYVIATAHLQAQQGCMTSNEGRQEGNTHPAVAEACSASRWRSRASWYWTYCADGGVTSTISRSTAAHASAAPGSIFSCAHGFA